MRKSKLLAVFMLSLFALTGCGKNENVSEVLDASRKKMNELSNYSLKMEIKMGIKAEGMEMNIPFVVDAKIDEKSGTSKMTTSSKMMGMDFATEGYTQVVDGKTVTYSKGSYELDGEQVWTKETSLDVSDYKAFASITQNSSKISKKKSNDKNANYYEVTISKEKMKSLMSESSGLMGDGMDMESYDIKNDVVVGVYVDKNSNYMTKLTMDLKDVISIEEMEEGMEITEFSINLTFGDFDKIGTITIPEDVITSAIDQDADWDFEDQEGDYPKSDLEM